MRVHRVTADDTGVVAILVALVATIVMVMAAFALDIGNAYAKVRQQSVAADASALAAAAKVGEAIPRTATTCDSALLSSVNATSIAQITADSVNSANSKDGVESAVTVSVQCVDGGKAVEVAVSNSHAVPTSMAGIIGINQINAGSNATARYVRVNSSSGLRPWAVCDTTAAQAEASPDTTFATGLDNKIGVCSSQSAGNWGAVDFDGGNNAAGTLANWTLNGYPNPVPIPNSTLPADPGLTNSSALGTAFTSLVNQVVLLPSVTGFSGGNGNNGTFNAVGMITAKIVGVRYGGTNYNVDASGAANPDWVDPTRGLWVASATSIGGVGTVTTRGNTSTLTLSSPLGFDFADPNRQITTVTIAGAGGTVARPADLVTAIDSIRSSGMTAQLSTKATQDVTNATVTIQYKSYSGIVPLDANGKPIDHIQFRWVSYTTTSYAGNGATTCTLGNALCQGATQLWR